MKETNFFVPTSEFNFLIKQYKLLIVARINTYESEWKINSWTTNRRKKTFHEIKIKFRLFD